MEPLLRASLATLAALSVLGGVAALARPALESASDARRSRRLERIGLVLHHALALGVALSAAALAALLGAGDGRVLVLCAAGPLLVLSLQDVVSPRASLWSVPIVAVGLVVQALILLRILSPAWAAPVCGVGALASAAGAAACFARRRALVIPRARALIAAQGTALVVVAFGALTASVPPDAGAWGLPGRSGLWAVAIGAAGAVATAARLAPAAPPGLRDAFSAFLVFALALVAGAAAGTAPGLSFTVAAGAALASLGAFVLVRGTFDVARRALPALLRDGAATAERKEASLPSAQALAAMAPLLDDALLRRPSRPRVIARVPARRLLDAALEKARSAQPSTRGRREDLLRVEVVAQETEIDIDGDPADLAEALCAVLDNALRARALHPDVKVQVQLRGSAAAVTFEISDMLPDGTAIAEGKEPLASAGIPDADAPFMSPRVDADRPGLGVSLARARLLVERNGGKLLTRTSAEGSFVQVTMPRRMQKGAVGQA